LDFKRISWELPRISIGLVYLLWGIDKFLSTEKYVSWISITWRVRTFIEPIMDFNTFTYILGIFEVTLGLLLIIGLIIKISSLLVVISSILFLIFAGPPMSYPQDIALIGTAIWIYYNNQDKK